MLIRVALGVHICDMLVKPSKFSLTAAAAWSFQTLSGNLPMLRYQVDPEMQSLVWRTFFQKKVLQVLTFMFPCLLCIETPRTTIRITATPPITVSSRHQKTEINMIAFLST